MRRRKGRRGCRRASVTPSCRQSTTRMTTQAVEAEHARFQSGGQPGGCSVLMRRGGWGCGGSVGGGGRWRRGMSIRWLNRWIYCCLGLRVAKALKTRRVRAGAAGEGGCRVLRCCLDGASDGARQIIQYVKSNCEISHKPEKLKNKMPQEEMPVI